ncbi:MAG: hypothetical protein IPO94_18855 [Saprospiraceae bacterium]|nr:hypothetical protein [Saprospiraceae bacterium]
MRSCIGVSFNMINFTATLKCPTNYGKVDNTNDNCTFAKIRFNHHGFVLGNHTIDSISIFSGKTLSLGANNTQHINNFSINGSCLYSFTTLQSTLAGTRATISNMGTSVDLDHMNIRDINAIGGATIHPIIPTIWAQFRWGISKWSKFILGWWLWKLEGIITLVINFRWPWWRMFTFRIRQRFH